MPRTQLEIISDLIDASKLDLSSVYVDSFKKNNLIYLYKELFSTFSIGGQVTSVNALIGDVPLTGTSGKIVISATNVFNVGVDIVTLSDVQNISNKTGLISQWTNDVGYLTSIIGYTPTTTTLTINGQAYDLSSNRAWNVGTVTSIGTAGLISGGTITGVGTITTSMNTNKLVGRGSSGVGIMEEITLGTGLSLSGNTLNAASVSPAALTKTDDTNVTLTLSGAPATALLAATSLTLGWTGRLALSRFTQGTNGTILQGVTSSDSIYTSSPTISTSVTTPLLIGGTGTGSDLILQSTSGVGDDTSWIISKAGNNGAVEVSRQGVVLSTDSGATGGTITTSGLYTIHTFTSGGTFTVSGGTLSVEYLVVAGGGGGGGCSNSSQTGGGGGGAGGYKTGTLSVSGANTVTVGGGGAGGVSHLNQGADGANSIFASVTSTGGGGGGAYSYSGGPNGRVGGSGSGAAGYSPTSTGGAASPSGQGNNGGNGGAWSGGGGGGAGAVGGNFSGSSAGAGGAGTANSISGSSVTYAGGGGGGAYVQGGQTNGAGGAGGGGAGASTGVSGTANTGGGGGGAAGNGTTGGNGGSGIVIIRYLTPSSTKRPVVGINKSDPKAMLHIGAGAGNQYSGQLQFDAGALLTAPVAGTIEYDSASSDNLWFTINTGLSRKGFIFNDGTNLTTGKIPVATTGGRLIDGQMPLSGTKIYYVSDSSGGSVTRKLTFINGILTSET